MTAILDFSNSVVSTFDFHNNLIRVVEINNEPWFVAKDVCDVLGFTSTAGTGWLVRHLDESEIQKVCRSNITQTKLNFPNRGTNCISESGLYKLIMRSDKPEAKPFQDWVTRTVLPAIRKDGVYIMGEEKVATGEMSMDEMIQRSMHYMDEKIKRIQTEVKKLES